MKFGTVNNAGSLKQQNSQKNLTYLRVQISSLALNNQISVYLKVKYALDLLQKQRELEKNSYINQLKPQVKRSIKRSYKVTNTHQFIFSRHSEFKLSSSTHVTILNSNQIKWGTANNDDGTGATKLAFTGDVAFVAGSSDVKVNLRYSDFDLFNDKTYFGLVKEDGKPEASTCLDLKLWKYTSNTYSDPEIVNDLPITPSNNFQNQWRYYSFTIPGAQLSKRLVQTSNANQFIYKGYYAIIYYAAGSDQVQYTFYFEFSVTIDRATGSSVDTAFKPLSHSSIAGCTTGQACVTKADTKLNWCSDTTCTIVDTQPLQHQRRIRFQCTSNYILLKF